MQKYYDRLMSHKLFEDMRKRSYPHQQKTGYTKL